MAVASQSSQRPNMTFLDALLAEIPGDFELTRKEERLREKIVRDLQLFLRTFFKDCMLLVFGSTANGFCFHNSDVDVCIRFLNPNLMRRPAVDILEEVASALYEYDQVSDVQPILGAKVPIIKLSHSRTGLAFDLSLYSAQGVHTARLVKLYSQIDERFRILGYTVKVMVKLCEYDGYHGYLAVSTYIIMLIFFLQQRRPPVLPVLHQLYEGDKLDLEEEETDVYYFKDIHRLADVWPSFGKNKESVGQLWMGFLRYYAASFDPHGYVISIRDLELKPNPKPDNSHYLPVEDPVAVGVVHPGIAFREYDAIMNMFENAYEAFASCCGEPAGYASSKDYLFDPEMLKKRRSSSIFSDPIS